MMGLNTNKEGPLMYQKNPLRLLSLLLVLALLCGAALPAYAAAVDFSDVPSGHWAYDDVMWARQKGIVVGVGGNRFAPGDDVSYAAMVKMLCTAFFAEEYAAYEASNTQRLEEVFEEHTYWFSYQAYFFLSNKLLTNAGAMLTNYNSMMAGMNRNNMAQMIANVLVKKGVTVTDAEKKAAQAEISDFDTIPAAYQDAVLICYSLDLLNGTDGQFLGSNYTTRAQACAVIRRVDGLLNSSTEPDPEVTPSPAQPDGFAPSVVVPDD